MENMQANLKIINVLKSKGITAVYDLRQRRGKKKKNYCRYKRRANVCSTEWSKLRLFLNELSLSIWVHGPPLS